MSPSQYTTQLMHRTIKAFNADDNPVSSMDGIRMIDSWISALHSGDASTNPIASTLSELKIELQRGSPNAGQIEILLSELADQAQKAAQNLEGAAQLALMELSTSLKNFSQQLGGQRGPAHTSGRTPMSSTVGDAGVANVVAPSSDTGSSQGYPDRGNSMAENTQGGGSYGSGYGTGSSAVKDDETSGTGRSTAGDASDMDDNASRRAGNTEEPSTSSDSDDTDTGASSPEDGVKEQ